MEERTSSCGCVLTWNTIDIPYWISSVARCEEAQTLLAEGEARWNAGPQSDMTDEFEIHCLGEYYAHMMEAERQTRFKYVKDLG